MVTLKSPKIFSFEFTGYETYFRTFVAVLMVANDVTEQMATARALEIEKQKKQKAITEAVIATQEKERQRIGGELHDNVNQILATSMLYPGLINNDMQNKKMVDEAGNLIQTAIEEIRNLSHSIIPPALQTKAMELDL